MATEELYRSVRVTIGFFVTSLAKALLPWLLSLAGRPALERVLVVPNFFHLRMMEPLRSWGPSILKECFGNLPQICASTQSCLGGIWEILSTSWLVFFLTCTVNCGTLYRQVCAFTNHVQSIEFTTGGLQWSCRNSQRWSMETGCTWAQFRVS